MRAVFAVLVINRLIFYMNYWLDVVEIMLNLLFRVVKAICRKRKRAWMNFYKKIKINLSAFFLNWNFSKIVKFQFKWPIFSIKFIWSSLVTSTRGISTPKEFWVAVRVRFKTLKKEGCPDPSVYTPDVTKTSTTLSSHSQSVQQNNSHQAHDTDTKRIARKWFCCKHEKQRTERKKKWNENNKKWTHQENLHAAST